MIYETTNKTELLDAVTNSPDDVIVVDFWASWCGPCKVMSPIFESVSENILDVTFIKVQMDEMKEFSDVPVLQDLTIRSIPFFVLFNKRTRTILASKGGTMSLDQLTNFVDLNKGI